MTVIQALSDDAKKPPVSNSYSHQRLLGPRKRLGEPQVHLEPADEYSLLASTDCSGWLSFVLNTVSPLHQAVLQVQRERDEHNRVYSEGFALREHRRPWPRAFVVAQYFRSHDAPATGFELVKSFEDLRPGDIGAYAMGRYAKPSDESRPKPRDTGHVFIVAGTPSVVDPAIKGYDGRGTLSEDAAKVIAVPVIDSSATVHFDRDSRMNAHGRYTLPEVRPHSRAKPGGVGTGTIWFALSEEGRVLQRRIGPHQRYRPVLARAARLSGTIALDEGVLDGGGALPVRVFDNSPAEFGGIAYGNAPVHLTGEGALRLGKRTTRSQRGQRFLRRCDGPGRGSDRGLPDGPRNWRRRGPRRVDDIAPARDTRLRDTERRRGSRRGSDSSRFQRTRPRTKPANRTHDAPLRDMGRTRLPGHVRRPGVFGERHPRALRKAARIVLRGSRSSLGAPGEKAQRGNTDRRHGLINLDTDWSFGSTRAPASSWPLARSSAP